MGERIITGIDLDNTIINYDGMFYDIAIERGLIPGDTDDIGRSKNSVRDFLKSSGKEDDFTELQGVVYGPRIFDAKPFPGIIGFLEYCKDNDVEVFIISHKTRYPFIGEKYDLHNYAIGWLRKNIYEIRGRLTGISDRNVYLESTMQEKIKRIIDTGCDYFIDDLPEFLSNNEFPERVKRMLFDPDNIHPGMPGMIKVSSWESVKDFFEKNKHGDPEDLCTLDNSTTGFGETVENALRKGGFADINSHVSMRKLAGGKNNQVFKLTISSDDNSIRTGSMNYKTLLLKKYFRHPNDKRDRLDAEYRFIKYLSMHDVNNVPKPHLEDKENGFAVYDFIDGKKVSQQDIHEKMIRAAADFIIRINNDKDSLEAKKLPVASEACFSIKDHLATVERRLQRLKNIIPSNEVNKEAILFVEDILTPEYESVSKKIKAFLDKLGLDGEESIPEDVRILSPSDFGFHNIIIGSGGMFFIDFEYAGWDDPAKLICDFFSSPQIPVPMKYFESFSENVLRGIYKDDENVRRTVLERTKLLLPLIRIKWCCIMLNEFMPVDKDRRAFALSKEIDDESEKRKQLKKVRDYLHSVLAS